MAKEKGKRPLPQHKPQEDEVLKRGEFIEPVDEWPKPEPSPPPAEKPPKDEG